jgi:phage terminase small subunit
MDTMPQKSGEENKPKLRPRHALFVKHYIDTHNQSEAVRLSGFKCKDPSKTATYLMKRPDIIGEIRVQEELLHKSLSKDKPTFLRELQDLKRRAREKNKIDSEIKIAMLEAQILGLTKEEPQAVTNIFQNLANAKEFISSIPEHRDAFKDTIAVEAVVGAENKSILDPLERKQSALETANDTTQMSATHQGEVTSTLSGEVITLNPGLWAGVEG